MGKYAQSIDFLLSQVRDSGGYLANGKVYAYAAGTSSTPLAIWVDHTKNTEAANPYTLDSLGTAQLYGDGLYRFVIESASGAVVYDRDYISVKEAAGLAYDATNYANNLNAAVAAIGSTPATLQFNSDLTVTANIVIPATIELVPMNGAVINHGSYSVTYHGSTANFPSVKIFNGTGSVLGLNRALPEWFGGAADGVTESSAAINKAIAASLLVTVGPGTWRCDDPIMPKTLGRLELYGELARLTAYSASTKPVVAFNNVQISTLTGNGRISSQNASPNGVVLIGPEDPTVIANQTIDNEWNRIVGVSISGASTANGNIGVKVQCTNGWSGSHIAYMNKIAVNEIHTVGTGIYFGAECNGNFIKEFSGWNLGQYGIRFAGADGIDIAHGGVNAVISLSDNVVQGAITHASPTLVATLYCESAYANFFSGMHGEPGSGKLFAFDAASNHNVLHGMENHPNYGTDLGTLNTILTDKMFKTNSPCFSAFNSVSDANVTGDGTSYQIICDTEIFDKTANHDTTAGGFTAPVTGQYRFSGNVYLTGLGAAHTTIIIRLVTTARTYIVYTETVGTQGKTSVSIPWSQIADMAAGNTAFVTVQVSGSTKTVNVFGGASPTTTFAGSLVL